MARGSFWRGTTIAIDSRLRIGRAIAKTEEEVALELMAQLKARGHPKTPPAMATDGKGSYREATLETWGLVPEYGGRGRPPTHKQPDADWRYLQVVKERCGSRLIAVHTKVVYCCYSFRLGRVGRACERRNPAPTALILGPHQLHASRQGLRGNDTMGKSVWKIDE